MRELMYWNLDNTARREGADLVKASQKRAGSLAVCFSTTDGGIFAFRRRSPGSMRSSGRRFPLASTIFSDVTSGKAIPQSYAMAIARQENTWNPKVKSRSGQRPDADCPSYRDPYGEDVSLRLWWAWAIVIRKRYQHWHQLSAICLSAVWRSSLFLLSSL